MKRVHMSQLPIPQGPSFSPEQAAYVVTLMATEIVVMGRNSGKSPWECQAHWEKVSEECMSMGCTLQGAAYGIAAEEMAKMLDKTGIGPDGPPAGIRGPHR